MQDLQESEIHSHNLRCMNLVIHIQCTVSPNVIYMKTITLQYNGEVLMPGESRVIFTYWNTDKERDLANHNF